MCFDEGGEDLRGERGNDCIARNAEEAHASGKPINQKTNSGFNAPGFSVRAGSPFVIGPEATSACSLIFTRPHELPAALLPFFAGAKLVGVGHVAANPFKRSSPLLAPLRCFRPPCTSATVGVGQTMRPESELIGTFGCGPPSFQSRLVGVGHVEKPRRFCVSTEHFITSRGIIPRTASAHCASPMPDMLSLRSVDSHPVLSDATRGVGHVVAACAGRGRPPAPNFMFGPPFSPSLARGVAHGDPIKSRADVRRIDGASRNINRSAGVVFSFQVSGNSVEPTVASRSCNLLAHNDRGPTGADESKEVGPKVPWIVLAKSFTGDGERLARAASRPQRRVVWPSGHSRGDGPETAAGEEVTLRKTRKVFWIDVNDGPPVDDAVSDNVILDETFEDMSGDRIVFVVVDRHRQARPRKSTSSSSGQKFSESPPAFPSTIAQAKAT